MKITSLNEITADVANQIITFWETQNAHWAVDFNTNVAEDFAYMDLVGFLDTNIDLDDILSTAYEVLFKKV